MAGWKDGPPDWMDAAPDPDPDEARARLRIADEDLDAWEEALGIERPKPDPAVWAAMTKKVVGRGDNKRTEAINSPQNIQLILEYDPRWLDRVRRNEFSGEVWVQPPGYAEAAPLSDVLVTRSVVWIETTYGVVTTEERVGRAINAVAEANGYHPVIEYLDGLSWDRTPRLHRLLPDYFGALDVELHAELGRCWMVSAVARVREPGCKVDTTLILVGRQGARKSTACRVLAGEWFSDTDLDLKSKDLYESIHGVWIYELAEIDSFRTKSDRSHVKRLLSSPTDRYRRPYGKAAETRPRQVVFVGTTNEDKFLNDSTGSRRFWPVKVDGIDLEALERDRDQLWAEADALYKAGSPWWLSDGLAKELAIASEDFQESHPWIGPIADYVARNTGPVTIHEVLEHAVKMPTDRWSKRDEQDVAECLKALGYARGPRQRTAGGGRVYPWVRP